MFVLRKIKHGDSVGPLILPMDSHVPAVVGRAQTMAGAAALQAGPRAGLCLGCGKVRLPISQAPGGAGDHRLHPVLKHRRSCAAVWEPLLQSGVG